MNETETKNYKEKGLNYINDLAGKVTRFYDSYWNRSIITNLEYLVFGVYKSESNSKYIIYRIDKENLEVDNTESWHNDRFKERGFVFSGPNLDKKYFERHKKLVYSIPQEIYKCKLKTHNSPDNYTESKIVLEYKCHDNIYKFTIDIYDNSNEQELTESMKRFVNKVLDATNEIKNITNFSNSTEL